VILVVSYPQEDHTVEVVRELQKTGREVRLLCLSDFPVQNSIEMNWSPSGKSVYIVNTPEGKLNLSDIRVTWWRRILQFKIDPSISRPIDRAFSESETSQAINGMLDSLNCHWINPRAADESAHRKPYQWEVAQRIGLTLPRTLVTNDPAAAKLFIDETGVQKTVFKAFLATTEEWRETRIIELSDVNRLESVKYAPVIFQEYIEGVDLRITVVGDQIFAAEIDARKTSYPYDMRMVIGETNIKAIELPLTIRKLLLSYMKELGLQYGAIDMRRTTDGRFVFLEVNPAGQWLFVEHRCGLPITVAMAKLLAEFDDHKP